MKTEVSVETLPVRAGGCKPFHEPRQHYWGASVLTTEPKRKKKTVAYLLVPSLLSAIQILSKPISDKRLCRRNTLLSKQDTRCWFVVFFWRLTQLVLPATEKKPLSKARQLLQNKLITVNLGTSLLTYLFRLIMSFFNASFYQRNSP